MGRGGNERLQKLGRRWRTDVLAVLAYTLLALVLTWPLAAHFGTHVPGNGGDDPPLTWNLWWTRYALLDQGTNPFDSNYLFYPLGINLAFYTLTLLNGMLSLPLQAVLGLIPASNLLLLSSFVLSGYGAFLLARYFLSNTQYPISKSPRGAGSGYRRLDILDWAAALAGLLYAFASSKMTYAALGQWNVASSQWIPFYVLCLFKSGDTPRRWQYPVLAALFLLFQAYAELTYASFLVLFTILWLLWRLGRSTCGFVIHHNREAALRAGGSNKSPVRLVMNLAVVGLLFVVGLIPVLAMMLPDLRVEGDVFATGGGFADVFSADLLGFLVPTMHHPLLGSLVERFHFDHTVGQHIYVGYSVLILAALGAAARWRRPAARFWTLSTLIFWLLTLGPTLRIDGHDTGIPLPFTLVAQLPFFKGNRYPSRYSVMLILSLAILVAFGVHWLLNRVAGSSGRVARRRFAPAACCLLLGAALLFESLSIPLPLSDMRVPPIYRAITAEMPGDLTLLDLPVAWRNGARVTGTQDPIIMLEQYYQTEHQKPILAGNTSRNPPLKFQYFTEAPLINTLLALETGHSVEPAIVADDRILAADVLRFFNIQVVVVHPSQTGPEMVPYVESTLPVQRFYEDGETIGYRVDLPPWPDTWTIEPGTDMARLSYAEGWGVPSGGVNWAQRKAVRLLVPMDGNAQAMTFGAYAPDGNLQLRITANGEVVQRIDLASGWMNYEVSLPASAVRQGLNEIWLHLERLVPAREARLSARTIGETGTESPVNLVVQSAGLEVGNFGHIYVNGEDVSPNARGYNVAVLNPVSGEVEGAAVFDTHLDEGASQDMARFLSSVPPGYIVCVAAADEASRLLDQGAAEALRGIGAEGDLRGNFRWGQAIVGVQGAPAGSALEAMDWMRPVSLVVGEGATEPDLAAAFASITFRSLPGE
jgi:hypothetical protein